MNALFKATYKDLKVDAADVLGFCVMGVFSIAYTILLLILPTLIFSYYNSFIITPENIKYYYIVAIVNIFYAVLLHRFSESYLLEYNIEYKRKANGDVSYVKRISLAFSTLGSISNRMIISIVYIGILVISHLQELGVVTITNSFVSQLIQINKYSFVILAAIDKLVYEYIDTKTHIKYKFSRWLELFYMNRLRILPKASLDRIEELFIKKRYRKIFFEFYHVLEAITDGVSYYEYLKICDNLDKDTFSRYFIALYEDSLIVIINEKSKKDVIEYLKKQLPSEVFEKILQNQLSDVDFLNFIKDVQTRLSAMEQSMDIFVDEKNNKVIISISKQKINT